jgi:hypothetical protein
MGSCYKNFGEANNTHVERFLAMLRFDSREKLTDFPLDVGK